MKVIILADSVDPNTPNTSGFLFDWIVELSQYVDKIDVITHTKVKQQPLPENVSLQVNSGNNSLIRNYQLLKKTVSLARNSDTVIFSHMLEVNAVVGGLVGKLLHKPSFFWYCSGYDVSSNLPARFAFRLNTIITCNDATKQRYIHAFGHRFDNKIKVVGHGVNTRRFAGDIKTVGKQSPIKILYSGRISPIKDIQTLLTAVSKLSKKHSMSLTIAGPFGTANSNNRYKHQIINAIRSMNKKTDLVKLKPAHSYQDSLAVYRSADLVINPSISKSVDKVFLEALASGITSIGSNLSYPDMSRLFPQLTFKAGDANDLMNKIEWLIEHPRQAKKLTLLAQNHVNKYYNISTVIKNIVNEFTIAQG